MLLRLARFFSSMLSQFLKKLVALQQPFQIVKILLAFILGIGAKNTRFHIKRSPINASLSLTIRKIVFGEFKVIQPVYIVPFDKSRSVLV